MSIEQIARGLREQLQSEVDGFRSDSFSGSEVLRLQRRLEGLARDIGELASAAEALVPSEE